MTTPRSRRAFLEQLGIGTAGVLAGGYTATAAGFAKNETIHIGVIGCGGRAVRRLMPALAKIPGTKVTAVCDIYDEHLAAAKQAAPGAFATDDYHKLLKRSDVDAVIIGSPDHWHVPMTVDACAAGKDVYVEKPLTHTIAEGQSVIDAQNRFKRVVQVGTQQRSMPQFHKARELVQAGALGPVHKIHMCWNRNHTPYQRRAADIQPSQVDWARFLGNARRQPFDAYRFRNWRWFWDFGGGILTDLMVHWLDAVYFLQDMGLPAEVTSIGDNFSTKGIWETPDTIQTLMRYPGSAAQLHFEGTFASAHRKAGITLMGENATLYVDRGMLEVTPEAGRKGEKVELVLGSGGRGADFSSVDGETLHLNDWFEAIRTRRKPSAPAEAGVISAQVAHLGNQAYREGKVIRPKL
jgi:predicted dehydrogenase